MSRIVPSSGIKINYLEDDCYSAFFDLRTELEYYCSIPTAKIRRDHHAPLLCALARWFANDAECRHDVITSIVNLEVRNSKLHGFSQNVITEEASAYFNESDIKSIETLKKAYRREAKRHHPDSGGSLSKMIELNNLYEHLQRVKSQQITALEFDTGGESSAFSLRVNRHYTYHLGDPKISNALFLDQMLCKLELEVLVDDWNLDEATLLASNRDQFTAIENADAVERLDLLETLRVLVQRCYALARSDLCKSFEHDVHRFLMSKAKVGPLGSDHYEKLLSRFLSMQSGEWVPPAIAKHDRQRDNIGRLTKRRIRALDTTAKKQNRSIELPSFSILAFDPPKGRKPSNPNRIAYPPLRYNPPFKVLQPIPTMGVSSSLLQRCAF